VIGQDLELRPENILSQLSERPGRELRLHSALETLRRDLALGVALTDAGYVVHGPSERCVRVATDKVLMKQVLDDAGITTARWWAPGRRVASGDGVVVKRIDGTQSQGIALRTGPFDVVEGTFAETYVAGTEYSVAYCRPERRTVTFPPVFKGRTTRELVPPWRRMRLCPDPWLSCDRVVELHDVAARVLGVSDAELLEKAMKSYRKVVEDAITKARELAPPGEVPPIKLPDPEVKMVKNDKLYLFHLPAEWKLDPQMAPTAGLSARVGVLALSFGHAERLLTSKPLKLEGGPLADPKRPLAGATYFNWPALVDVAKPWVLFALEKGGITKMFGEGAETKADILKQVRTVLDVLKVFRISTSATYIEKGVLITHSEMVIRDE